MQASARMRRTCRPRGRSRYRRAAAPGAPRRRAGARPRASAGRSGGPRWQVVAHEALVVGGLREDRGPDAQDHHVEGDDDGERDVEVGVRRRPERRDHQDREQRDAQAHQDLPGVVLREEEAELPAAELRRRRSRAVPRHRAPEDEEVHGQEQDRHRHDPREEDAVADGERQRDGQRRDLEQAEDDVLHGTQCAWRIAVSVESCSVKTPQSASPMTNAAPTIGSSRRKASSSTATARSGRRPCRARAPAGC